MTGDSTAATIATAPVLPAGIERTSWPAALPPLHVKQFLSIISGNTRLSWCVHDSYQVDFVPTYMWKTAAISPFDETKTSREAHLSEFLPGKIFEKIFGTQAGPNDVEITAQFATRQVSMLPVYVVSTNDKELPALIDLLKPLPVCIFLMQAQDFPREIYPGIGVDRVAALHAAEKLYGKPSLVIDGGTALTWTTTDPLSGGIRGGISPGLSMRFRALHEFTGKLPSISQTELTKRLNRCIAEEIPLPFYAGTTMDAIISSACREVTLFLAYVIRECTTESKRSPQTAGDAKKKGVAVCLTGGSAQLIRKLLSSPDHSGLLPQGGRGMEIPGDATIEVRHSLVHDGLAYLLLGKTPPRKDLTKEETVRNLCIGQRVIVRNKSDGLVRGSILGVDRAEQVLDDVFLVKLEDYSMERFDVTQICAALKLYSELGESEAVQARIAVLVGKTEELGESTTTGFSLRPDLKKGQSTAAAAALETHLSGTDDLTETVDDGSTVGQIHNTKRPAISSNEPRKKARTPETPSLDEQSALANPEKYLELRIAKCFEDGVWYFGTVAKFTPRALTAEDEETTPLWKVKYDDGDREEFDAADLVTHLTEYEFNKNSDTK